MVIAVRVTIIWIILLLTRTGAGAGEIPREPLDQLWEEHMVLGTAGSYIGGERTSFVPYDPPEAAKGSPGSASLTTRGIFVQDFRGTALLGILRGGGWVFDGGMLGQVERPTAIIELYGKQVWRLYPGFLGNYAKFREEETYEFFLLKREKGNQRALLLKKWIVRPEEIKWFVSPGNISTRLYPDDEQVRRQNETRDVRGFFTYDSETQEAEVSITGLIHPLVERVKVPLP
jgi:hypothetical protein